jgi:hypothetical protein
VTRRGELGVETQGHGLHGLRRGERPELAKPGRSLEVLVSSIAYNAAAHDAAKPRAAERVARARCAEERRACGWHAPASVAAIHVARARGQEVQHSLAAHERAIDAATALRVRQLPGGPAQNTPRAVMTRNALAARWRRRAFAARGAKLRERASTIERAIDSCCAAHGACARGRAATRATGRPLAAGCETARVSCHRGDDARQHTHRADEPHALVGDACEQPPGHRRPRIRTCVVAAAKSAAEKSRREIATRRDTFRGTAMEGAPLPCAPASPHAHVAPETEALLAVAGANREFGRDGWSSSVEEFTKEFVRAAPRRAAPRRASHHKRGRSNTSNPTRAGRRATAPWCGCHCAAARSTRRWALARPRAPPRSSRPSNRPRSSRSPAPAHELCDSLHVASIPARSRL